MPHSDTGERVTPVLEFPSRDGLVVHAIRVDYEPGGFTRGTHRHPAGAYGPLPPIALGWPAELVGECLPRRR
jgi:hypothetical protein